MWWGGWWGGIHSLPHPLSVVHIIDLKPASSQPLVLCTRPLIVPISRIGLDIWLCEGLHPVWKIHFVLHALAVQEQEEWEVSCSFRWMRSGPIEGAVCGPLASSMLMALMFAWPVWLSMPWWLRNISVLHPGKNAQMGPSPFSALGSFDPP